MLAWLFNKKSVDKGIKVYDLCYDVINQICSYLDHSSIINFISMCSKLRENKKIIYDNSVINHTKILYKINESDKQFIVKMKISLVIDTTEFINLHYLDLTKVVEYYPLYYWILTNIKELHISRLQYYIVSNLDNCYKLVINDDQFNKSLKCLPKNLKTLIIFSKNFNQELINLPNSLITLKIYSKRFNKNLNNLPMHLKKLVINSKDFNLPFNILFSTEINFKIKYLSKKIESILE